MPRGAVGKIRKGKGIKKSIKKPKKSQVIKTTPHADTKIGGMGSKK